MCSECNQLHTQINVAIDVVQVEGNRLRGKLFEVVEAVGFPQKQEDAIKRLIRSQSYASQNLTLSALRGVHSGDGAKP